MSTTSPLAIRPVTRRSSLPESVFRELSARILHGDLVAGSALPPERELAELLGVNRGVLREGIKRLEQAGLVEPRQGGGTFVCDYRRRAGLDLLPALLVTPDGGFQAGVVRAVMEMRSALAPDVARRAAERAGAERRARLRESVRTLEAADSDEARGRSVAAFWNELVDASDNVAYRLAYNALLAAAEMGGVALRRVLAVELEPLSDYASLVAALGEGDASGAAALAARIVRRGELAIGALLAGEGEPS